MKNRKHIIFGAAVLVLALLFGAIGSRYFGPYISWAAQNNPTVTTTQTSLVTTDQQNVAAVMPTQDVLSKLYDQVAPSVVNIQVTIPAQAQASPNSQIPGFPFGFPFGQPGTPSSPAPQQAEGSGFVYDNQGHIVTNNHVVENADSITVYYANGMWSKATVVARDAQADLAVIKVTPPNGVTLTPLSLAPADSLRVGYYVAALGSPFGLNETMTFGVVSALGRSFPTGDTSTAGAHYSLPDVIQTDAAINPGNSGGPLLNLNGEVVGVNFAINSPVRANSGVGFAIPVSVVEKVVPALIKDGSYKYSYLGIQGQTITASVAKDKNLPDNTLGILVGDVVNSGPAEKAGIQANDIVVGIDNQPVHAFEDLVSYLFNSTDPGQQITLHILRNGKAMDMNVTLAERPSSQSQASTSSAQVTLSDAIKIAKQAVTDAGLMNSFDSASAKPDTVNGQPVWVVTLTSNNKSASVVVDGQTGEILSLNLQ